ncbi:cyclic-phosphate processing receiver domain-containing protein [Rhodococcus sp. BE178]|uniref:cyclic-phosphate processing receiver domain-containing protein n=1 Tax=Rhodococcus sp. BE178 TaxID=2817737 RepID=UPI003D20C3F8
MKLFVDDERPAPKGWVLAQTAMAARDVLVPSWIARRRLEALSLDHDLGGDETTRPIVLWMCENDWWPREVYVHSGNPVGEEWLVAMVRRYAPAGTLKGYGLNFWGSGPDTQIQNWEAGRP